MTKTIGLTGGIATGKSTAARQLRSLGLMVFDADATVHQLMREDEKMIAEMKAAFPSVLQNHTINRRALGDLVFANAQALKTLERIVHPRVRQAEIAFIHQAICQHQRRIVLDIPLLYETGADLLCDVVWLVDCPAFLQVQRVMQRGGMSEQKCQQIIAAQMPQAHKRKRADAVVHSGLGKGVMMRQLKRLVGQV